MTLCRSCRFNELRRYTVAERLTERRGCWHHIVIFPNATHCDRYEREVGVDDAD